MHKGGKGKRRWPLHVPPQKTLKNLVIKMQKSLQNKHLGPKIFFHSYKYPLSKEFGNGCPYLH